MTGAEIVLNKLKDKYEFIVVTSRNDIEADIAREKLNMYLPNERVYIDIGK